MTNGTSDYWARFRFPEIVPGQERRVFGVEDLKPGWDVHEIDGDQIGRIREVGDFLVVRRGFLQRDLHLPLSSIRSVAVRRVDLNIDVQAAERHGWDRPPRVQPNTGID